MKKESSRQIEQIQKVFEIRSYYVMLASKVAEAFEVETRQIVQNVKNNPSLFPEKYAFQLTSDEIESLRSLGMISKPGRGGSRELPWVITRKGAIRLATIMKGKKAIEAADIFIDVFDEVLVQLYKHRKNIKVSNPSRIVQADDDLDKLRKRIVTSLDDLLNTVINSKTNTTLKDELQDVTTTAIISVKEFLRSKKVDNEKVEAETLLIIEKARDIYERRQSELEDAKIDRETKILNNFQKKIEIAEKLWDMYKKLEPNAVVDIIGKYVEKDSVRLITSPDKLNKD
ncbi:MAG: ORF6N domain-containing protein [Melioribacteraceae bacterium]|nr:ORF6N domain-containing protein [Melioribacteraceae bacterium]MCF8354152.1 ORF6N domain-containing protein [Melioribacteraceae bacterium]MCF8396034.1 ORF6N domain-containing protein [Melioribacteraceae bacterium]MCF8418075.1 ORF6N domain-containing protein [Melioribacteraceae bacterium]